jgi:hypothetical protein
VLGCHKSTEVIRSMLPGAAFLSLKLTFLSLKQTFLRG